MSLAVVYTSVQMKCQANEDNLHTSQNIYLWMDWNQYPDF